MPVGIAFLVLSFILIGLAGSAVGTGNGGGNSTPLKEVALGLILLCVAIVLLAPACLGLVGWLGQRAPISVRLALRDLSRYRSRSGPALAAIAVATLIAVIVCVEAAARLGDPLDYAGPNLSSSQLIVYTAGSYNGPGGGGGTGSVPPRRWLTRRRSQTASRPRSATPASLIWCRRTRAWFTQRAGGAGPARSTWLRLSC